jgi:hypothetical protein
LAALACPGGELVVVVSGAAWAVVEAVSTRTADVAVVATAAVVGGVVGCVVFAGALVVVTPAAVTTGRGVF